MVVFAWACIDFFQAFDFPFLSPGPIKEPVHLETQRDLKDSAIFPLRPQSISSHHGSCTGEPVEPMNHHSTKNQVILSLLIGAYSCGVLLTESSLPNPALHIPSPIAPQPRGFFWDWLSDRTKGGSTPAPAQRPGDRQDESSSADLTGTWILGGYKGI